MHEDDPFGLHNGLENYSASKIASEALVEFIARSKRIPATIVRIFMIYGPAGGSVTSRVDLVADQQPIPIYSGGANYHSPMYIDDAAEKITVAATLASVPPLVVNFGGSERCSVQEYTKLAGDLLGVDVFYRESDTTYYPISADVERMHATLGRCRVGIEEGVQPVLEHRESRQATGGVHSIPS
jgi:nucleoside-diphosphate-sugar epimerase